MHERVASLVGVFSVGGELLILTESVVQRWKEYFEDLLNPTNMHSEGEAGPNDFGLGSVIIGLEVAGVVKHLLSWFGNVLVSLRMSWWK